MGQTQFQAFSATRMEDLTWALRSISSMRINFAFTQPCRDQPFTFALSLLLTCGLRPSALPIG